MNPIVIFLIISTLLGLAIIGLLGLKRDIRRVVPKLAIVLAALPFLAAMLWPLAASLSPELKQGAADALAGSSLSLPESAWFFLALGTFTAAFILSLGYVYGDAKRRGNRERLSEPAHDFGTGSAEPGRHIRQRSFRHRESDHKLLEPVGSA